MPAFCRVAVTAKPTADSDIKVEVWLPDAWNGKLLGVDNGRLYALAMALSLAIVAVAGIFLGIRTTFTFSSGPDRLLFAFEAVIIGGLGSLWGTLVGGVILGIAQTTGARLSPGWGVLAGHLVFLAVLHVEREASIHVVRREGDESAVG